MDSFFAFKNWDIVAFDNGIISGIGTILGCTTAPLPVIGRMWIIDFDHEKSNVPQNEYPYSCIGIPECHIRKLTDQELEEYNA